jgi:hypothetical protein
MLTVRQHRERELLCHLECERGFYGRCRISGGGQRASMSLLRLCSSHQLPSVRPSEPSSQFSPWSLSSSVTIKCSHDVCASHDTLHFAVLEKGPNIDCHHHNPPWCFWFFYAETSRRHAKVAEKSSSCILVKSIPCRKTKAPGCMHEEPSAALVPVATTIVEPTHEWFRTDGWRSYWKILKKWSENSRTLNLWSYLLTK